MPDEPKAAIHLEKYRGLIRHMVGEQPVHSSAPRPFPQLPSVYYDGTNDIPAFNNWLHTLLLYFRTSMMCGEENDDLRVSTAAKCLKGMARDWFFARVAAPGFSIPYKFEGVVVEMARVFLASRPWQVLPGRPKYTPRTTARAFYFQIQHWYEMGVATGEEQGDSHIEKAFLLGMREAMLEVNPAEGEFIKDWFRVYDRSSVESMLTQTQNMLATLEARKYEAEEDLI